MARVRKQEVVVPPEGMPERLRRFEPSEWMEMDPDNRWRVYHARCDYGRARAEWFEANLGVDRSEAWRLARLDNNSGAIGYWSVLGNTCKVAELSVEAGLGDWPEFCRRRPCRCAAAGEVVAVNGSPRGA